MKRSNKIINTVLLSSMLLPPLAGYVAVAAKANILSDTPSCQIQTSQTGGSILIKASYLADETGQGSYQFGVSNGRNVNINQGGNFSALKGEEPILGQVMIGTSSKNIKANLHIMMGNQVIECQEDIN